MANVTRIGSITVAPTPPDCPFVGDEWWNTVNGQLFIYYDDGNTRQWVIANRSSGGTSVTTDDVPPSNPKDGDLWWDSTLGELFVWYDDGNSSQWVPATTTTVGPTGPVGPLGPVGPVGPVGPPSAGAVNVVSYGVTMNGTTDDTATVTAAVSAAASTGAALYWPPGTALTTASIPLLHTVQHIGPGRIKRGANFFYVAPKPSVGTTNHLFVAPAGTTSNDGLSATEPTTPQTAATALRNYGPVLQGTWQIDFAAGSYAALSVPAGVTSMNPVRFIGPPTGDFTSVPTAIIDKALSPGYTQGLFYSGAGSKGFVKDIKAIGFSASYEAGFRADNYSQTFYENVHADSCYFGIYQLDFSIYHTKGGVISNCYVGVQELFTVIRNFKYAGSTADRTIIRNCTFGGHCKELCTGHWDFAEISDCTYGIMLLRGSTMNPADMIFKRNQYGVVLSGGAKMVHAGDIQWNAGTADANVIQVLALDPQLIENVTGGGNAELEITPPFVGQTLKTFGYGIVPFVLTGTTANTIMINSLGTLQAGEFQAENTQVRLKAFGTASLVAGTALLFWRVGGVQITSFVLPIGAFLWEFEAHYFVSATGNNQRFFGKLTYTTTASTAPAVVLLNSTVRTNPHSTTAYTFNLTGQLAVATDSVTANFAEGWTTNR